MAKPIYKGLTVKELLTLARICWANGVSLANGECIEVIDPTVASTLVKQELIEVIGGTYMTATDKGHMFMTQALDHALEEKR